MKLAFRPMRAADLPWVAARERELHFTPWSMGNFADSLLAGYNCWLAWEEGENVPEPVGYAVLVVAKDQADLLNITIAGAWQRRGIGGALLDFLCRRTREAGVNQMFLEVRPSNAAAQALYQRAGFEFVGRRKGYYPCVEGREDALVMRRAL